MKKAISAKIDEEVYTYCKSNGGKINTLINTLLRGWMEKNKQKQIIAFQVETGTDILSQMSKENDFEPTQCCNKCIQNINGICKKTKLFLKTFTNEFDYYGREVNPKEFCCIYFERRKKGG